jgi:diguanylate cyclase (GGDEF)-like protein
MSQRFGDGPRSGAGATLIVEAAPDPTERTRGVLTIVAGAEAGRVFPLPEVGMTTLGRAPDCELKFDDASVSGNHAQIARIAGVFILVDNKSTNGTYVNEARTTQPVQLQDGDRIRLGKNALLRFSLMNAAEEAALRQVYEAALRDGLTGVFNRKHLEERIDGEIAYATRQGVPLSVAMVDIDFFKRVNDTYGHQAGDAVLKAVAQLLTKSLRAEDFVARYGGEEFTIIARGTDLAHGVQLAERVRMMVERTPAMFGTVPIAVTASLGVASLDDCGDQRDKLTLLSIADRRLYAAKHSGRNRVVAIG